MARSVFLVLFSALLMGSVGCTHTNPETPKARAASNPSKTASKSDIETREVKYQAGNETMVGFLALPKGMEEGTPGVLVVHEWWGQTDYPRRRARMLAREGYAAFAVDMYGDRKTAKHPKKASAFSKKVMADTKSAAVPFKAALEVLRDVEDVDPERIAAIGYCFGGGVVLEMARQGADLEAVASFHGSLGTDNRVRPGDVEAAILVLHGEEDQLVPDEAVDAFRKEMVASATDFRLVEYPGAMHGFTNPAADAAAEEFGLPIGYDAEADEASWQELLDFLAAEFES